MVPGDYGGISKELQRGLINLKTFKLNIIDPKIEFYLANF